MSNSSATDSSTEQLAAERRKSISPNETPDELTGGIYRKLSELNLFDTLTNRYHSEDFNAARSEYIRTRVNILALVFAVFAPLWIPIDYLLLEPADLGAIASYRLMLFGGMLAVLLANNLRKRFLQHSLLCLTLLIAFPAVFYTACLFQLNDSSASQIGYSFIPFLLVAILSVFPLTILEAGLLGAGLIFTLVYNDFFAGTLFTQEGFKDLWLIATLLVIALWANQAQLHMLLRLYRQATRDPLTGLLNRRIMMERVNELTQNQNSESPPPISILMLDLDRFKRINDTYGHLTGDTVLQSFSKIMREELRNSDILTRYGGEEFAAILPDTPLEDALRAAERIRSRCEQSWVTAKNNEPVSFTVSIGVGELNRGETFSETLQRVDNSLYDAKKSGRNKVVQAN